MRAIYWILGNRLLVLLGIAGLALGGAVAWHRLPIDAFPDVTNTQVVVLAKAPGLAAVDVEARVSFPIEQHLRGLPRVTQVRSLSKAELSQVVVVFEDGADTYWTRQVVFERLAGVRESLPPGVSPELGPISTGLGEIFQYTLSGDGLSPMDLRSLQDWVVAPLLKPVAGVTEVNSFGGEVKQYQVLVRPERLVKYGLTVGQVAAALERSNGNAGGGVVVEGWEQTYLRGVGLLRDIPDLERVVLRAQDGTPVYLRDVADVVIGAEPRQGAVTRDAKGETVAGMVIMLKGENAKSVVARVKEAITKAQATLPPGARIDVFYDRTSLIEACIRTVVDALLEGGLFVVLVLFLFVAEWRTAVVVMTSLPLTFLATFIVMGRVGLTANLMSLGGLAFSVGMVVDASIVVVENVRRHLARRQRRFAVVVRFAQESRADLERIRRLLVVAPGGERVPLGQLAELRLVEAPAQVSREDGSRRVVVEANIRGRDLGGFVAEVRERLAPIEREFPSGTRLELGGQFENQERAMGRLAVVVPVALALILLLLYLALGSLGDALLVLLNLPFALVGGLVAVVLFGMPLSVSAAVAFIVLLGIAVQNGVVLVAFLRQLRERGRSVREAVREGCDLRFRPLLMTALTSFIGHLPMLYAQGSGADIQRPLAVVVMGGLVTSTALTMLVLPALYVALAARRAQPPHRDATLPR
jgi:Cu/Ag efflux pump CusA